VAESVVTAASRPDDRGLTHAEALTTLIALQTKLRPEQIGPAETIDGLFDGVSSRRNQVLMDLGAEFDAGSIDRAHEIPLADLSRELAARAPTWRAPGAYLQIAHDEALKRVLARSGLTPREAAAHLETAFGFGPGLIAATFDVLALTTRAGASARGGELGPLGTDTPTSKDQARSLLDRAVGFLGQRRGTTYGRLGGATSTGGGAIVDARAVQALSDKIFGEGGALLEAARVFARASGKDLDAPSAIDPELAQAKAKLEALGAELGQDFIALVEPRFDSHLHVAFASAWASAHRDLVRLALDGLNGRVDQARVTAELARLAPHRGATRLRDAALWFSRQATDRGLLSLADALAAFAAGTAPSVPQTAGAFAGRTALVTGASPGSIAVEVVSELLAGGARVVVTTTQANASRLAFYRRLYERAAAPGAELHVVPMNQASFADVDALVDWLFRAETEQAGATTRVLKPAFLPDLVVPFAALKDQGTVDQLSGLSEATLRAMVLSTERMIALIARRLIATGEARKAHVLLPLSPNHGAFGGDGAYAESKAALEVLLAKWTSEHHAWGRATTLVGARIGWVRGTGLMAQNDAVAPRLEAKTGIRTWSSAEMGRELAALLGDETRARAASGPIVADLSGGFDQVPDLKAAVDEVRRELELEERQTRERERLATSFTDRVHGRSSTPSGAAAVRPLPAWPAPITPAPRDAIAAWPTRETSDARARAEDLVVIVGFGEISPGGSARTRYEVEVQATAGRHDGTGARGRLSAAAVLELAWLTGLVRYEPAAKGGTWVDAESGDPVPEHALHERYHDAVRTRVGVRFVEPETVGFDPERLPVFEKVFLDKDFTFRAGSEEEARTFAASDPDRTVYKFDAASDAWLVTRKAGSELRVPREVRFNRRVAGQLPRGFSLARYGFGGEMLENVDPVALMNLAATVEAFISAGTSPEELLAYVHPSRIGTTQGSGMGGMRSLHRLYVDHLLGRDRQSDILQETLINVVFAYAASSYVGSYGPMAHPVAACATAALSLEDAMDKILLGKADVVMAGGWDDLSQEGVVGFGDMNATADTDKMEAMGILPHQMSRANDRRRRGFVEAQGGGAMLLARGDVALEMGLPVYGVLAYAGSFGDGINRSIPAPGIGSLGAAVGGKRSPLGKALAKLGLTADDIGVVSKHDTSTAANDPNESYIHQTLQDALGRTPGNPLMVVSQKTVLGHAKGGAAAWQTIGLCQMLASGVIPGNANLESVDPGHEAHQHLLYSNERLEPGPAYPLRAGLATSLGFGHVSALLLIAHPDAFEAAIADPTARSTWKARSTARQSQASRHLGEVMLGRRPLFEKRVERRFKAPDGSDAQRQEETAMLLDPAARIPLGQETFIATRSTE
jgi:fatty acid synthase